MVLVIVIIGILGKALTPVALASLRANAAILDVGVTVDKVRFASDRLAFEMRELSTTSITTATASTMAFTRVDYTGTATARLVTIDRTAPTVVTTGGVSQNQCDGTVRLNYSVPVISPAYTPVLTDRVCSLTFAYYDQTGATTAVLADVRYVDFTLTLQPNATGQSYSQRTRVALRNH